MCKVKGRQTRAKEQKVFVEHTYQQWEGFGGVGIEIEKRERFKGIIWEKVKSARKTTRSGKKLRLLERKCKAKGKGAPSGVACVSSLFGWCQVHVCQQREARVNHNGPDRPVRE